MEFGRFESEALSRPLNQTDKAAAVLLAMGKSVAAKLLRFFTQSELQAIIASAQSLRAVPPHELEALVGEFEDLFTEGAGLMDNARAIESILEEALTPDEVDGLLGRRVALPAQEASIWDSLQNCNPDAVAHSLAGEHPQTIAYVLSMMPSGFGAKMLLQLSEKRRPDILNRALNIKTVGPKTASVIEARVKEMIGEMETERDSPGSAKVADVMNELEKGQVETLLASLETISIDSANKVRLKIFLFDDILFMPQRSRSQLLDDVATDTITLALRGSAPELREAILASVSARQRRMIESDLAAGDAGINPRDIAIARRAISQEAIRLAASGLVELKESEPEAA